MNTVIMWIILRDDSWGPAPDLFRYEVEELEPDNSEVNEVHILEAIDVKREKTMLTRDKCKYLIKLTMDYEEKSRRFVVKVPYSVIFLK